MITAFCAIFITAIAAQTNHKKSFEGVASQCFQEFPDLGLNAKHYKKTNKLMAAPSTTISLT